MAPINLTITLGDEDAELLQTLAAELSQTPTRTLERMIHRNLATRREKGPKRNEPKGRARAARQIQVAEHVKAHGLPVGEKAKRALAEQFGISPRVMYRDLQAVADALNLHEVNGKA